MIQIRSTLTMSYTGRMFNAAAVCLNLPSLVLSALLLRFAENINVPLWNILERSVEPAVPVSQGIMPCDSKETDLVLPSLANKPSISLISAGVGSYCWKLDSIRDGVTLLGTTLNPRAAAQPIKTWAGSFPAPCAILTTLSVSTILVLPARLLPRGE